MKTIIITRQIHELIKEELERVTSLINLAKNKGIICICVNSVQIIGDIRLFQDYFYYESYEKYPEPILVTNERVKNKNKIDEERTITYKTIKIPNSRIEGKLFFRSSSLTTAIDLAYSWLGTTECLLLANNNIDPNNKNFNKIPFEKQMQENVNFYPNLFCYKKENNFNLKHISLEDYINT